MLNAGHSSYSIVYQLEAFLIHISRHLYELNLSLKSTDFGSLEDSILEDFVMTEHHHDSFVMTVLERQEEKGEWSSTDDSPPHQ
jgi:hypothetical protein